jgi:hypothetical protein
VLAAEGCGVGHYGRVRWFKKGLAGLGVRARVGSAESNPTRVRSRGGGERGPDKRGPLVCGARVARLTREAGLRTAGGGEKEKKQINSSGGKRNEVKEKEKEK